jgi:hypothetical protein
MEMRIFARTGLELSVLGFGYVNAGFDSSADFVTAVS